MVAALGSLAARHAAEFGGPEDDGVFQHAARFQVVDQGGGRLVHAGCHLRVVARQVFVAVPVAPRKAVVGAAPHLHETDTPLQQAAGDQAVAAEIFRDLLVQPVQLSGGLRFAGNIQHLGALN